MDDKEFDSLSPIIEELKSKYGFGCSIRVRQGNERIYKFHSPSLKFPFDMCDPVTGEAKTFTVEDVLRRESEFCAEKFYGATVQNQMAGYTTQIMEEIEKLLYLRRKGKPVEIPEEITATEVKVKLK